MKICKYAISALLLASCALCAAQAMSASRVGDALAVELVDEYGAAHQVLLAPKAAL